MTCSSCGKANRAGAAFCAGCGRTLIAACPACGADLASDSRFCDTCGAPVTTAGPEPATAARKVVTILFADLSGSTAFQERLDAEATRRVMDRVHRLLAGAVEDEGGQVVKYMGDGLMAVFGIPMLREDDALRAVRAGAAMQESFAVFAAELLRDLGADVGLRVGINTGEVVVADDSADVVGDPVNIAARLESAAALGDVLMGSETGRIVRDFIPVEPVDPIPLKGKGAPVAAMRLAATGAEPSASTTAFVGRDDDVERLVGAFDETVRGRRARLVTVVGSPGLGKSRLAGEVARSLASRATVLEARCASSGGSSFGPVVDALRRSLDLDDTASEAAVMGVIRARCQPLGVEDAARVAATVAALMFGSPPGSAEQVFWSLRRMFEALSQERPVVLLIDDVHWAEPALLDLVEHIAEWARGGPVLLLALARPELRDRRATLVEVGGPSSVVVVLGGLDETAGRRLALDLLATDALPADVLSRALEASEGNPLFLRELLRLLVDDGVLQRVDGEWKATIDAGGIELPATIHAALASRIEQLRPAERAVLETASVVGRHFPRGAVLALLPPDVGRDLDAHLESLRRRELVDAEGMWRADDRLFRFHHALIRDAAYRRVLKEVRADLHERYSEWLTANAGAGATEHDEVLGWHLEQAHLFRVELGERGSEATRQLADRAATHLGAAARRALDRDDVSSAASLLGRALQLTREDDPARRELLRDHCDALIASGDTAAASLAVADLVAAASTEHEAALADVFDAQLAGQRSPEALRSVVQRAKRASEVCSAHGDDAGVAHAELALAEALIALGQVGACESALDHALAASRRVGDRRRSNAVLAIAPLAALWGPSPVPRASGRCLDLIRVLRITSWAPLVEAHVQHSQAVLEALRDRPEASRRMLESARSTFEDLGHRVGLLQVEMHAGIVEVLAGEPATAEGHLRRAREGFTALGSHRRAAQATALLARALLELEQLDEAAALAAASEGGDDLKATIGLLGVRSELLARQGSTDEAEALARRAVDLAAGTDALLDHADARVSLSRALAAAGRHDEAESEAARARELYEAKGAAVGVRRAGASAVPAASGSMPAVRVRHRARPNAATRLADAVLATLVSGDVETARAMYVPDAVYVHHETGEELGRDEHLTVLYELFGGSAFDIGRVVFATSGDRLAISRVTVGALDVVWVAELDGDGRFVRIDAYSPDDLDLAFTAYLERIAGFTTDPIEARNARALARVSTTQRLATERRWPEVEALFSPTLEVIDHRVGGTGQLNGRDGWMEFIRLGASTPGGTRYGLGDVLGLDVRRGLAVVEAHDEGRVPGGGVFESDVILTVCVDREGLGSSIDIFETTQVDRALARFDELAGLVTPSTLQHRRVSPNLATTRFARWAKAMNERDLDTLARLRAPDEVTVNHELRADIEPEGLFAVRDEFFGAGVHHSVEPVATLGALHSVDRVVQTWPETSPVGAIDYRSVCVSVVDADGCLTHMHRFSEDQISKAMALFVEMWGESELDSAARDRALTMSVFWRSPTAFGIDWDAFVAHQTEDVVVVDHRPAGWEVSHGREATIERGGGLAALTDEPSGSYTDVLAFSPDVAVVSFDVRGTSDGGASFSRPVVTVSHFGSNGLVDRAELFSPEDAEQALTLFDRWEGASSDGGAPASTAATRALAVLADALGRGGDVASLITSDYVLDDRRPLLEHRLEGAAALESQALISAGRCTCEPISTRGERLALVRAEFITGRGHSVPALAVGEVDGRGLICRLVVFDPEDEDAAYALLDECAVERGFDASVGRYGLRYTAATRFAERWVAALASGEPDQIEALCAPAMSAENRRSVLRHTVQAQDAIPAAVAPDPSLQVTFEPVATRGELLALVRLHYRHPLWSKDVLALYELTADHEQLERAVSFDLSDEDAAFDELDRRAFVYDADMAAVLPIASATTVAYERGDVAALRAAFTTDAVIVDHRPAGWGTASVDEYVQRMEALVKMGASSRSRIVEVVKVSRAGHLSRIWRTGRTADGGSFETELWFVGMVFDGRISRLEQIPIDRRGDAEEAFARVSMSRGPAPTMASEFLERWIAATSTGDRTALATMAASDVVMESRRPIVGISLDGGQEVTEGWQLGEELLGRRLSFEMLATRGERLGLARVTWHPEGADVSVLAVGEVDSEGQRLGRAVMFDPTDEDAAYAELDARAVALADEAGWSIEQMTSAVRALNSRHLDSLGFHPDAIVTDHSPGGMGTLSAGEYRDFVRGIYDLADEFVVRVIEVPLASSAVLMFRIRVTGRREGGSFEIDYWQVSVTRDGQVISLEQFPVEERRAADACFERLTGQSGWPAPNAAFRHSVRWHAAVSAGDLETVAALSAPDMVLEDRRLVVGPAAKGVAHSELVQHLATERGLVATVEPIATRGQRLVLMREAFRGPGWAIDALAIVETDELGAVGVRGVEFDPDDEDAAWAELDARAIALAGDAAVPLTAAVTAIANLNARTLEALALDPLATLIDHRPGGWGTLTSSRYIEFVRTMYGLAEQFQVRLVEVPRANSRAVLSRIRVTGVQAGGVFELEDWTVITAGQGTIGHLEQFPLDRRAEAEACFESFQPS